MCGRLAFRYLNPGSVANNIDELQFISSCQWTMDYRETLDFGDKIEDYTASVIS
jgi:hypothetical protein